MPTRMKHWHFNFHTASTHHMTFPLQSCLKPTTRQKTTGVNKNLHNPEELRIVHPLTPPNLAGKYQSTSSPHTCHTTLLQAARLLPTSRGTIVALGQPNHSTLNRRVSLHARANQPKTREKQRPQGHTTRTTIVLRTWSLRAAGL